MPIAEALEPLESLRDTSCPSMYQTMRELNDFKNHAMHETAKEDQHKPDQSEEAAKRATRGIYQAFLLYLYYFF